MGARTQILIEDTGVYLYSHWGANTIIEDMKKILSTDKAQSRINDPEYLSRIIFSELIKDDIDGECNFGISTEEHGDTEILFIVNCDKNYITVLDEYKNTIIINKLPIDEFIELSDDELDELVNESYNDDNITIKQQQNLIFK
jgi:hypothetical protein